jgi:hypothetical protein
LAGHPWWATLSGLLKWATLVGPPLFLLLFFPWRKNENFLGGKTIRDEREVSILFSSCLFKIKKNLKKKLFVKKKNF